MNLASVPGLFDKGPPVYVARAPGRLDVMGGIADYSGALVLQLPIAEAAEVAVQQTGSPGVTVASLDGHSPAVARIVKLSHEAWVALQRADYPAANEQLTRDPSRAWVAYVLGPVLVLRREKGTELHGGLRILVDSRVPEGKGVSSSAAVEVATMRAFAAAAGLSEAGDSQATGQELARLCQLAENLVIGAPCGIMDQMTSALGRESQLLALRCQPAIVEGYVPIPRPIAFWGIDSGIRHAVSGSNYTSVRCGAFMGYRILAEAAGLNVAEGSPRRPSDQSPRGIENAVPVTPGDGHVEIDDPFWHGYLANLTPAEFRVRFDNALPGQMTGREFLARYGGTTDRVTRVDPARTYAIHQPTIHPIEEHARVTRYRELLVRCSRPLEIRPPSAHELDATLHEMGELMFASHASYSACGLGSDGTDRIVELVRHAPADAGLYGAKITGGGSGGTVAILARASADHAIQAIAQNYSQHTGHPTYVFRGSSPGACAIEVISHC